MYLEKAIETLKALKEEQTRIEAGKKIVTEATKENRLVHVFGTDPRSSALIAEVFFRPEMPISIDPMCDPTLDYAHGAYRNEMALQVDQLALCILDYYERVQEGDPIILIGSDQNSRMFVQSLAWAKQHKLKIITISEGNTDADVPVITHSADDTFMIAAAAILNMMMDCPEDYCWTGEHTVDLEENREKINQMLFRVRHL